MMLTTIRMKTKFIEAKRWDVNNVGKEAIPSQARLGGVDEESDVPGDLRKLRYKYSENYS